MDIVGKLLIKSFGRFRFGQRLIGTRAPQGPPPLKLLTKPDFIKWWPTRWLSLSLRTSGSYKLTPTSRNQSGRSRLLINKPGSISGQDIALVHFRWSRVLPPEFQRSMMRTRLGSSLNIGHREAFSSLRRVGRSTGLFGIMVKISWASTGRRRKKASWPWLRKSMIQAQGSTGSRILSGADMRWAVASYGKSMTASRARIGRQMNSIILSPSSSIRSRGNRTG